MHILALMPLVGIVIIAYALQIAQDYILHLWYSIDLDQPSEPDEHSTNSI